VHSDRSRLSSPRAFTATASYACLAHRAVHAVKVFKVLKATSGRITRANAGRIFYIESLNLIL
jgi:hypothetical protein